MVNYIYGFFDVDVYDIVKFFCVNLLYIVIIIIDSSIIDEKCRWFEVRNSVLSLVFYFIIIYNINNGKLFGFSFCVVFVI